MEDMMELEEYHLVLLRRPDNPAAFSEAKLDELQARHLAYLETLADRGLLALNGPLLNQPDVTMRGLSFYCTETAHEALRLAERDPMVRAGRLRVELMQFWARPGSIAVPGTAMTVQ
jgi:uncharacterized protein YciI